MFVSRPACAIDTDKALHYPNPLPATFTPPGLLHQGPKVELEKGAQRPEGVSEYILLHP